MEDAAQLSGFEDGTVDAVTCTWGMDSSPDPTTVLRVSTVTDSGVPTNLKRALSAILRWKMNTRRTLNWISIT